MSSRPGQTIGNFTLVEPLGARGLFESWRATAAGLDRPIFLKIARENGGLSPDDRLTVEHHGELWRRFARHPFRYMPSVLSVGEFDGRVFVAADFIDGATFPEWLGLLPESDIEPALWYALKETAKALRELHALGLVHGDVSPTNILASFPHGMTLVDPAPVTLLPTPSGPAPAMRMITPGFAAPEVLAGNEYLPESDLYGLGASAARMREVFNLAASDEIDRVVRGLTDASVLVRRRALDELMKRRVEPASLLDHLRSRERIRPMAMEFPLTAPVAVAPSAPQTRAPVSHGTHVSGLTSVPHPAVPSALTPRLEDAPNVFASMDAPAVEPDDELNQSAPAPASRADFLVTAPPVAPMGESFAVELWVGPSELNARLRAIALKPGRMVERTTRSGLILGTHQTLTIALSMPGFEIDEPVQQLLWTGQIANVGFFVKTTQDSPPGLKPGRLKILVDNLPIASILFDVQIAEHKLAAEPAEVPAQVRHIARAFASYASDDRHEVIRRVQGMRAVGVNVFMDILGLRAGESWEPTLYREIRSADAFFLFWSDAARKSQWVEKEWRFALAERGLDFIDPVPLADPRVVPPPAELSGKHFNDIVLIYLASLQTQSQPANKRPINPSSATGN